MIAVIIHFISLILIFFVYYVLIQWINELDENKCQCNRFWHYKFIYINILIIIVFNAIQFLIIYSKETHYFVINPYMIKPFLIFSMIYNIAFFSVIIDFINKLRDASCNCGSRFKENFIYIYSLLAILLSVFLFTVIFLNSFLLVR